MGGKRRQEALTPWTPKMARQVALSMSADFALPPPGSATGAAHPGAAFSVGLPPPGLATDASHPGAVSSVSLPPPGLAADSLRFGAAVPPP
eukprot:4616612-Amphidinium_carterae.1